jgi:hypothetical protein
MSTIEPDDDEILTHILTWKPLGFLNHILGVPIPALIGPSHRCSCDFFFLIRMEIICRHIKRNQKLHRFMSDMGGLQVGCPSWFSGSQSQDPQDHVSDW